MDSGRQFDVSIYAYERHQYQASPSMHISVTIYAYMRHHLRIYAAPITHICITHVYVTIIIKYNNYTISIIIQNWCLYNINNYTISNNCTIYDLWHTTWRSSRWFYMFLRWSFFDIVITRVSSLTSPLFVSNHFIVSFVQLSVALAVPLRLIENVRQGYITGYITLGMYRYICI